MVHCVELEANNTAIRVDPQPSQYTASQLHRLRHSADLSLNNRRVTLVYH